MEVVDADHPALERPLHERATFFVLAYTPSHPLWRLCSHAAPRWRGGGRGVSEQVICLVVVDLDVGGLEVAFDRPRAAVGECYDT